MTLFIASALILLVSFVLIRDTSPFSMDGGAQFERRQMRAVLAKILFVAGLMLLSIAVLAACLGQ